MQDKPLDHISVAPPEPDDEEKPAVRDAHDADDHKELAKDPGHEEGKLEVGLDESFPSSDPPSVAAPGHGDPAPSSGYDEAAEKKLAEEKSAS